jgi:hypothetical protein
LRSSSPANELTPQLRKIGTRRFKLSLKESGGAMSIEAIDHLYIETRSFGAARAFWEGLGFQLVAEWGDDGHHAGRLESGAAAIVLAESETPIVTVHFKLADADAFAGRVGSNPAVGISVPLEETHWGTRWIRVENPDGFVFVLEETASSDVGQAGAVAS